MEKVEVLPKPSLKLSSYIFSPIFFLLSGFMLWDSLTNVTSILFAVIACIGLVISILWIPYINSLRITFDDKVVTKNGFISKRITYEDIRKLVVRKGFIEVHGPNILETISIGDLYTNFDQAGKLLSSKINNIKDLEIKGSDVYLHEYINIKDA